MGEAHLYEENTVVVPISTFLRKVLRIFQVLPPKGEIRSIRHIFKIFIVVTILNFPIAIGLFGYMFKTLQDGFKIELIECIFYIVQLLIYWFMLAILVGRADQFDSFILANETYRFGIPRTIRTRSKLIRIWGIFSLTSINLLVIGHAVVTHHVYCHDKSIGKKIFCEVGFPAWYFFNVDNVYIKTYIKVSRWITAIILANVTASYCLIPENVLIISARIRHLESLLIRIHFWDDVDIHSKKLHFCIRYHKEIKRMVIELNDTMGYLLIPEFTLLILMLSLLEFKIIFEYDILSLCVFLAWFSGPIFFCETGHVMNEEYEKLRWAVYATNWYDMPPKLRKTFILLQGSVQRPIHFLVPPIFCMNRESLLNIVKGSYTFFMYLRSLSDTSDKEPP